MRILIALSLLPLAMIAVGQKVMNLKSLTTTDGLSQNSVNQILQGSDGYIWLATQDGLNRFNGYEFEVFRPDPEDSFSVSDNFIIQMFEDSLGRIWISTRSGINVFDVKQNRFHKLVDERPDSYPQKYFLRRYHGFIYWLEASLDSPTICRLPETFLLNQANHSVTKEVEEVQILPKGFYFYFQNGGELYALGENAIYQVNSEKIHQSTCSAGGDIQYWDYLQLSDSTYMLPGSSHLQLFDPVSLSVKNIGNVGAVSFEKTRDGNLVGTNDGLYLFQSGNNEIQPVTTLPHRLTNTTVHDIFTDTFGQIWLGTANKGVFIYDPKWEAFELGYSEGEIVWGVAERSDFLYVATQNGLYEYRKDQKNVTNKYFLKEKITAVFVDSTGALWVGTSDGEVLKQIGRETAIASVFDFGINQSAVSDFIEDKSGNIWVGAHGGLYKVNPDGHARKLSSETDEYFYVMDLYEDDSGNVWVGTNQGLSYFTPSERLVQIPYVKGDPKSINFYFASAIQQDDQGNIWVGTYGGGISRLNPDSTFTHFTEKEGLSNNVIHAMVSDDMGGLWFVSNGGLTYFDTDALIIKNYDQNNGIGVQDFALSGGHKFADGKIGFGSINGLLTFYADSVLKLIASPDLKWEGLSVNYKPIIAKSLDSAQRIDLYYEDRVFSLNLAALKFDDPSDVSYQYKLDGFNLDWVDLDPNARLISYSSLPFDHYELLVKASSKKNLFDPVLRSLTIVVHPPYWLTWWFISITVVMALGAGAGLVYYLSRRKLKLRLAELETRERVQRERERISRDLHDSVGTHFAYIISRLDFLYLGWDQDHVPDKKDYLNKLSDFARSGMKMLRETIWALSEEQLDANSLKLKIDDYLKLCFANLRTNYSFKFDVSSDKVKAALALNTFRIIQETVSNALKHADAKNIAISFHLDAQKLRLEISDDGKGFNVGEAQKMEDHYGLENLEKRANELAAQIQVQSGPGGTRILVFTK
ncbi:MAG: two-component regulator propeller domain-containing protein [Marinoscillum sp.]